MVLLWGKLNISLDQNNSDDTIRKHWMQSNINRLALTFGRPVLGVHNKTSGIIFDVLQCLIQRNFNYATMDIRDGYKIIKATLYNPNLTKVISF
jgi:hypothetical protein